MSDSFRAPLLRAIDRAHFSVLLRRAANSIDNFSNTPSAYEDILASSTLLENFARDHHAASALSVPDLLTGFISQSQQDPKFPVTPTAMFAQAVRKFIGPTNEPCYYKRDLELQQNLGATITQLHTPWLQAPEGPASYMPKFRAALGVLAESEVFADQLEIIYPVTARDNPESLRDQYVGITLSDSHRQILLSDRMDAKTYVRPVTSRSAKKPITHESLMGERQVAIIPAALPFASWKEQLEKSLQENPRLFQEPETQEQRKSSFLGRSGRKPPATLQTCFNDLIKLTVNRSTDTAINELSVQQWQTEHHRVLTSTRLTPTDLFEAMLLKAGNEYKANLGTYPTALPAPIKNWHGYTWAEADAYFRRLRWISGGLTPHTGLSDFLANPSPETQANANRLSDDVLTLPAYKAAKAFRP